MERILQAVVYSARLEGELDWKIMFELIQLSKQSPRIREDISKAKCFQGIAKTSYHNLPNMSEEDPDVREWVNLLKQLRSFMKEGKEASS